MSYFGTSSRNEKEKNVKSNNKFIFTVLMVGVTALALPAFADDAKSVSLNSDDVKRTLGVSLYIQAGYTYNMNTPATQENGLRVFDHKADSFTLDLAQLVFQKEPARDGSGYKIKISAGETAKWIHSRGLSGIPVSASTPTSPTPAQAGEGTDAFDVTEAFMSYVAPIGKGLRFDLGKIATYHGAEVIEAKDNPNYSRSFLFNYAVPFTHTGLKISYPFSDALSASLHVVNGWDNSTDNNKSKTIGLSIGFTPSEMVSAYLNYMQGPEQDNVNGNSRSLVDVVATIKPSRTLAIILNADSCAEKGIAANGGDAKWSGAAGIVKYDFSDKYSLSLRAESFDDKDGVRTGTAQKLTEVTVTPEIRLNGGLIVRPEYRHDSSDKEVFPANAAEVKKTQDTIALGVMYAW